MAKIEVGKLWRGLHQFRSGMSHVGSGFCLGCFGLGCIAFQEFVAIFGYGSFRCFCLVATL